MVASRHSRIACLALEPAALVCTGRPRPSRTARGGLALSAAPVCRVLQVALVVNLQVAPSKVHAINNHRLAGCEVAGRWGAQVGAASSSRANAPLVACSSDGLANEGHLAICVCRLYRQQSLATVICSCLHSCWSMRSHISIPLSMQNQQHGANAHALSAMSKAHGLSWITRCHPGSNAHHYYLY